MRKEKGVDGFSNICRLSLIKTRGTTLDFKPFNIFIDNIKGSIKTVFRLEIVKYVWEKSLFNIFLCILLIYNEIDKSF